MAQRYPADFDGIFSRVPVIHWTGCSTPACATASR